MRRAIPLLIFSSAFASVVIDRIAIIVGKQVIKLSDMKRDLLLTEFINHEPVNLSQDFLRKSAERLIDQLIIRNEIARGGYRRPTDSEVEELMAQLRRDRYAGSQTRLGEALSRYGLNEMQLRDHLLWQLTVLRFIDERFRSSVLVTDDEIRAYYNKNLAALKRDYPERSTFEALESKLRAVLEGERINQNFSNWLAEARKRTHIDYRQEAFQ